MPYEKIFIDFMYSKVSRECKWYENKVWEICVMFLVPSTIMKGVEYTWI